MLLSALTIASVFGKLHIQNTLFPLYTGAPDVAAAVVPVAVENKLPPLQAKKVTLGVL